MIASLFLPVLLFFQSVCADVLEVVQSPQGMLELVRQLPKEKTQSAQEVATAKKPTTPVSKTHAFIKNYGLIIAACAPMVIDQQYLGPVNGMIAGAALGAVINDTDRLKGAVFGATVGTCAGIGMEKNNCKVKRVFLRAAHGAILNVESTDTIVNGVLCGATQGAAETAIERAFRSSSDVWENEEKELGTIPATIGGALVIAGIGLPKNRAYPVKAVLGELVLKQVSRHQAKEELDILGDLGNIASKQFIKHLVDERIKEKFTELAAKRAQAAQDKKVS